MTVFVRYVLFLLLAITSVNAQAQLFQKKNITQAEELYDQAVKETRAGRYQKAIALGKQALGKHPEFLDQQLLMGRLYMLTGNYPEARRYVQLVISKSPKYRDAWLYAVNIEMMTRQYAQAEHKVDEALKIFVDDKEFMLKKLSILDATQKFHGGNIYAEDLVEKYRYDSTVQKAYVGHHLTAAQFYKARGIISLAQQQFDKALAMQPNNAEAQASIMNMYLRSGSYQQALEQVNAALSRTPGAYDLLMRKLGLLQEMHDYPEALSVLQQILQRYPNDEKARSLDGPLRMEAASWFANSDPYLLYSGVLEKNPGNREALDKVIGLSMASGAYREALNWINRGLRSNPNDQKLLSLKLDVLESDRKFTEAAVLAERLWRTDTRSSEKKNRFIYLKVASGRDYLAQQQYDLALAEFESVLQAHAGDTAALDMTANTYILRRDFPRALEVLNTALSIYPDNVRYLLKKSGVLAEMGQYDEAAEVASELLARDPGNERYTTNLVDLRLTAGRLLMQSEEYELARAQFLAVLDRSPSNVEALNYLVNLESAQQRLDSALYYNDQALQIRPDDKDLLLKKASILTDMKRYNDAGAITYALMQRYPFTTKYRNAYTESLMAQGAELQRNQQPDSALAIFNQVLAINKRDSLALNYSINILNSRQQYDSALVYANQAIGYYPGNENFLQKRAVTLENKKDYAAAAQTADSIAKIRPTADNRDYADYLGARVLDNQFGLFYLNSTYDYNSGRYNIATVEYRRFTKRGSWAARVNYAGRQQGTGLMGELEMYYTHNPQFYSYAIASYANEIVFPKLRLGYSLFTNFKHGIEAELGGRYLQNDSSSVVSGVVSIAKPFSDFWVNLRGYFISDTPDFYTSFNLTTRYYMNRRQDYLTLIAGLGTSPDDRSRLVQFPQLKGLLTRSVATGYQKTIRYRTIIGLFGTWINQKVSDTNFQNQYDVYITLQRKF